MKIKMSQFELRNVLKSFSSFFFRFFKKTRKSFVYVAIGDSTIEGIGATHRDQSFASKIFGSLKKVIPQSSYYNFGKAGARICDVIDNQLDAAIAANPDLIVISVGANDIFRKKTTPLKFRKQYEYMLKRLHNQTHALIVTHNIPDVTMTRHIPSYAKFGVKVWVKHFNGIISRATEKIEGVFVDVYARSKQIHGVADLISSDGLHPNDRGYAIWSDFVFSLIQPRITDMV